MPGTSPDGPRVEETHKSHTKFVFTPPCLRWQKRSTKTSAVSWVGQQPAKLNLKINTKNREEKGKDLYFHIFLPAEVQARHIPIRDLDTVTNIEMTWDVFCIFSSFRLRAAAAVNLSVSQFVRTISRNLDLEFLEVIWAKKLCRSSTFSRPRISLGPFLGWISSFFRNWTNLYFLIWKTDFLWSYLLLISWDIRYCCKWNLTKYLD